MKRSDIDSNDLLSVLNGAPAAKLTAQKAETVLHRGFELTGFVLCNPRTGERCIVEMSAVRWLDKDSAWWLMHESPSKLKPDNQGEQP